MALSEQTPLVVTDSPLDVALKQETINADVHNRAIIKQFIEQGLRPSNATYNLLLSSWATNSDTVISFKQSPLHMLFENDKECQRREVVSSINYAFIWALQNQQTSIAAFVFDLGLDFQALFPSFDDMEGSVDIIALLSSLECAKSESAHTAYINEFRFGYHEVLQAFMEFLQHSTLEQIDWAFDKSNELTDSVASRFGLCKNNIRSRCGYLFQQKFQEISFRNVSLFPALESLFTVYDKKINIATQVPGLLKEICEIRFAYQVSEALQSLPSFDTFHKYTAYLRTIHERRVNSDVTSLIQTKEEELWHASLASYDPVTFPSLVSFCSLMSCNLGMMGMSDKATTTLWSKLFAERTALVANLDEMVEIAKGLSMQEVQEESDFEPKKLVYLRDRVIELFTRELFEGRFSSIINAMQVLNSYKTLNIFFKELKQEAEMKVIAKFTDYFGNDFKNEIDAAKNEHDLITLLQICQQINGKNKASLEVCVRAITSRALKVIGEDLRPWTSYSELSEKINTWHEKGILNKSYYLKSSLIQRIESIILSEPWLRELDILLEKNTSPDQFLTVIELLHTYVPESKSKELVKKIKARSINLFAEQIDANHYTNLNDILAAYSKYYDVKLIPYDETLFQTVFNKFVDNAADYIALSELVPVLLKYDFYDAAIKVKRHIWSEGFIEHAQQYVDLSNEIIVGQLNNKLRYLEQNSELVVETLKPFVDSRQNIQELFLLQIFIANVPLHKKFQQQREELQEYVDIALVTQREKARNNASDALFDKVKKLYDEAMPLPELLKGPCQFYLLRSSEEYAQDSPQKNSRCPREEDINEAHPAIYCLHHEHPMGFHLKNSDDSCHCLTTIMQMQRGQLITCLGQPAHELPITDAVLHTEGLRDEDIMRVRHETLMAYYRALAQDHAEQYKWCANEYCHYPIWAKDVDKEGVYLCPSCEESFCFLCGEKPHPNLSCKEIEELRWLNNPASALHPCPWCGHAFVKDDRCNSVTCVRCKRGFHFIRGKMRENSTNRHSTEKAPRSYLVPGEKGYKPGKESADPPCLGNFISKY